MGVILFDNYDSFTHNLVQAFLVLGAEVDVVRCDEVTPEELLRKRPDRVVFGPGPGRAESSGCLVEAVRLLAGRVPILGVCLGHQAIALAFGGRIVAHSVVHGLATPVHHHESDIFAGLPPAVPMTRYHSLVVDPSSIPPCLKVTAWSDDGAIMGLAHSQFPVFGVQFHPESVLSAEHGFLLLKNFYEVTSTNEIILDGVPLPA